MGSIIAAMYAAGYSPAEMRTIVSSGRGQGVGLGAHRPQPIHDYYRQLGGTPSFSERARESWKSGRRTCPVPDKPDLLDAGRPGADRTLRSGHGGFGRRFQPPDGPVPLRGQRHEPPPAGGHAQRRIGARRSARRCPSRWSSSRWQIDSMLLYDGGIFDNFPWKPLDAEFSPRPDRRVDLHRRKHPAQREQQHHGSGLHARHAGYRLHASCRAERHDPPGRRGRYARFRPGRGHYGCRLRGCHGCDAATAGEDRRGTT